MGIDVESQATLDEAVDRAEAEGEKLVGEIGQIVSIDMAQLAQIARELQATVITVGPITIPAFTIRLAKGDTK